MANPASDELVAVEIADLRDEVTSLQAKLDEAAKAYTSLFSAFLAAQSEREAEKARADKAEAEQRELRRAIMGAELLPGLAHGNFLEMVATLHAAVDGGRERAESAEAERDAAKRWYVDAIEQRDKYAKLWDAASARIEKLEARLEIDHVFVLGEGDELVRQEVPAKDRDKVYDGIFCRDATIESQEQQLAKVRADRDRLAAVVAEARKESDAAFETVAQWHDKNARLCLEASKDDPRLNADDRRRAFEAHKHHAASAASIRLKLVNEWRAARAWQKHGEAG